MVERYRETGLGLLQHSGGEYVRFSDYADLQRQLAEARAERDTLREALRPFAVKADEWDYDPPIYDDADSADQGRSATPTIGDFRRARAALASLEDRA